MVDMEMTMRTTSGTLPLKSGFEQDLHGVDQLELNYKGFECQTMGHACVL